MEKSIGWKRFWDESGKQHIKMNLSIINYCYVITLTMCLWNKSHLVFLAAFDNSSFGNDLPGVSLVRLYVRQFITFGKSSLYRYWQLWIISAHSNLWITLHYPTATPGFSPQMGRLASLPWNILDKNQDVNCAKFPNFDRFCSQNL